MPSKPIKADLDKIKSFRAERLEDGTIRVDIDYGTGLWPVSTRLLPAAIAGIVKVELELESEPSRDVR